MALEGTYLEAIVASHRGRIARDDRDRAKLRTEARRVAGAQSFGAALVRADGLALIAECKRRSPSRGDLADIADPVSLGLAYQGGGAAAISVLTDHDYFSGSLSDLREISAAVKIPCLRKDFTVDVIDLYDARINGAAAILLIVAALAEFEVAAYLEEAKELGLDALVEVHSEAEIEVALRCGAEIIGINQRDLFDFSIDETLGEKLISALGSDVTKVLESGITRLDQVAEARRAGFDAILVGEALVRSGTPQDGAAAFVVAGRL